jgi:hypothetical protein
MTSAQLEGKIRSIIKNRQSLMASGLLVLLGLGLVLIVIVPQVQSIIKLQQKVAKEDKQLVSLKQKVLQLNEVLISPEYMKVDVVNQALPSKKPVLELLSSLSNSLSESGVQLDSLEVSPGLIATQSADSTVKRRKVVKKGEEFLALSLKISGSFSQAEHFMKLVEEMSPFTTITSFDLSERTDTVDENGVQIKADQVAVAMDIETAFFTQTLDQTLEKLVPPLTPEELETLRQLDSFGISGLEEQLQITGGGLEDLFGVEGYSKQLRALILEAQ